MEQARTATTKIPWWPFVMGGLALLLFGILAIVWPDITVEVMVIVFGAIALVDGVFTTAGGLTSHEDQPLRWFLIVAGVFSIVIGALILIWPDITAKVVLYIIATFAVITGATRTLAAAFWPQGRRSDKVTLILSGLVSLAFGVLIFAWPASGALAIVWLIGLWAIIFGVIAIVVGFEVLSLNRRLGQGGTPSRSAAPKT